MYTVKQFIEHLMQCNPEAAIYVSAIHHKDGMDEPFLSEIETDQDTVVFIADSLTTELVRSGVADMGAESTFTSKD